MALTPRTAAGLVKFRPVRQGSRIAIVAPASPFLQSEFDAGLVELRRLGLEPVYDETVFERQAMTAGRPDIRSEALLRAFDQMGADAVIAARGGYGSVELLPLIDADRILKSRTAFVGYSDVTSVHTFLAANVGLASVHGPMIERRLAAGVSGYDPVSFLKSLSAEPLGELASETLEAFHAGTASGTLVGGTLTQLLASFGTPYEFRPPGGHVLLLDEVNERPYRLHRMLMQLRLSGRLAEAAAVVFGQLPGCDEPNGSVKAQDAIRDVLSGFPGPVLVGFPSGHTTTPLVSLPFGVHATVVAGPGASRIIVDEAAAAE